MMTSYRNILGLIVLGFGLTSLIQHQADQRRAAEANTLMTSYLSMGEVGVDASGDRNSPMTTVTANRGSSLYSEQPSQPIGTVTTANRGNTLDAQSIEQSEMRIISMPAEPSETVMDPVAEADSIPEPPEAIVLGGPGDAPEVEEPDSPDDFPDFDFGDSLYDDSMSEDEEDSSDEDGQEPPDSVETTVVPNKPARSADDEAETMRVTEAQTVERTVPDATITNAPTQHRQSDVIRIAVNSSSTVDVTSKIDLAEISDPAVADILVPTPGRVIVVGKSAGSTQLLLKMGSDYRVFHVVVEPNLAVLRHLIRTVAPSSTVKIDTLNGQMVLNGHVPDGETAQRIEELAVVHQGSEVVNHLTIAGVQQTLLRVVVAEVNKDSLRALGVNWAVGGSQLSRDFFLSNNLGQLNPTNIASNGLADVRTGQLTYSIAPTGTGPNTNITFGFPRAELQFFFNALRENGLARTLAEPNLVAISGQTASFLAGGEVPIPISQGGSVAGAITIEYKEFGVRLAFTPTVVGGQIIRIHVMTEVSEAVPTTGPGAGGLPLFAFNTRRVESTIESGNDQTFAIAGLLDTKVNSVASKIPGLGDLPILGTLFSSVSYQKEETELVVLVTPQLVEPLDPDQVIAPPGSLMKDPSDFELFTLQQLEGGLQEELEEEMSSSDDEEDDGDYSATDAAPAPELQGPWGVDNTEMVLISE